MATVAAGSVDIATGQALTKQGIWHPKKMLPPQLFSLNSRLQIENLPP